MERWVYLGLVALKGSASTRRRIQSSYGAKLTLSCGLEHLTSSAVPTEINRTRLNDLTLQGSCGEMALLPCERDKKNPSVFEIRRQIAMSVFPVAGR